MDIKRITSGLLGFPLVLIILLIGNKIVVDIALAIIAMLAMNEYFNAVSKVAKPVRWLGYVSCISIALIHIIPQIIPQEYLRVLGALRNTNNPNHTICTSSSNRNENFI